MLDNGWPILSSCLLWPLFGAAMVISLRGRQAQRWAALVICLFELLLTSRAAWLFNPDIPGFQLMESLTWIPGINVRYQLGIDGISVFFLPMTALLTLMSLLAGWNNVQRMFGFHIGLLLVLETATIGVFAALDLILFFLFWELTLPPLFFLIGLWGVGAARREAAMKYVLYMLFGGVPLLFGIILLALNFAAAHGGLPYGLSFSLPDLLATGVPAELQMTIFFLLLLGFAVKAPLVPLHTWLPTTALEGPPQVTALLLGLKLGVYGLLRIALPLAPIAAQQQRWLLAVLGVTTLLHGALLALRQTNLRRLLAYAGISHVGLVLIGIASFNLAGLQGAVMQLLNFSVVASSLMLIAGMIQQRIGSNDLLHMGGLAKPWPRLTTLFFLFALSSIGVPGLNGFPAELLLFLAALDAFPALAIVALLTAVLAAGYLLGFSRKAFFGPLPKSGLANLPDLKPRELWLLAIPALLVLLMGLYPQWLIDQQQSTLSTWLNRLQHPSLIMTESATNRQTANLVSQH